MLKRVVAVTMAIVMLIMPMTASAVTWSTIVSSLNASGSYSDGTTTVTVDEESGTTTIEGGSVEFGHGVNSWIGDDGIYEFKGVTLENLVAGAVYDSNKLIYIYLDENTVVNGELNMDAMSNDNRIYVENAGTINAEGYFAASYTGKAGFENKETGSIGSIHFYTYGSDQSFMDVTNDGYIGELVIEEGSVDFTNYGTVDTAKIQIGDQNAEETAASEAAVATFALLLADTNDTSRADEAGKQYKWVRIDNQKVIGTIEAQAVNGSDVIIVSAGEIEKVIAAAKNTGTVSVIKEDGTIGESTASLFDGGSVSFEGGAEKVTVQINTDSADGYSAEEIKELVGAVGLTGEEVNVQLMTLDENGNPKELFAVAEDGTLTLIEVFDEEDEEEPEPEPDPIELQRQAEGIGGVTTSPVWNWQGYLGHSSKPMWIYVNGEKTMMRQRLFWLGDGTKNHTCRINLTEPDPASIELRVGLDMLRTAQRAEISVITILDSENNPIAQFAVSDLLGAFEQYGLVEGELLCVSGDAEAEVMKVTLEGEYLPLEE